MLKLSWLTSIAASLTLLATVHLEAVDRPGNLHKQIENGICYIGITSEQARRELLTAPVFQEAIRLMQQRI